MDCKICLLLLVLALTSTVAGLTLQQDPRRDAAPVQEPEPSTEPEPTSEPESTPEGEPEPEGESPPSYAEPEPDWDIAMEVWGSAWEAHVYFFGVAFALVALYSLFSIVRLYKRKHLLSQKYFISLNLLILLMGSIRSVYLLVDAYNYNKVMPEIIAYMLYTLFLPCVTSAFCLLFLSLLAATRMRFISPSIQKTKVILGVVIVHFTLAIVADILTVVHLDAMIILFICQLFYIIWGLFLFVGFMYIFGRLYKAATDRQAQMNKYALKRLGSTSKQNYKPEHHKLTLSLGTIVTLISSILGLLTVALLIYGMVDVYGVFEPSKTPEPWRWWSYHTAFRTLELAICVTVSYVATQPFRYSSPTRRESSQPEKCSNCSNLFFLCAPCMSWCQREHSYMLPEWSELRSDIDSSVAPNLHRNESMKDELPEVKAANSVDDEEKTNPESPGLGQTTPAVPKSDIEVIHFSSDDRFQNSDAIELDNLASLEPREQTTLKVHRSFDPLARADNSNNILTMDDEADSALESCNVRWSEQSLDKVSQMSPEMESSTEDEMSGLLVDV